MSTDASSFLFGWREIPNEIRLEILSYVLSSDQTYKSTDLSDRKWYGYPAPSPEAEYYRKTVLRLLSIPEISPLVAKIFYGNNAVVIEHLDDDVLTLSDESFVTQRFEKAKWLLPPPHKRGTLYPPSSAQTHVRRVEVRIKIVNLDSIEFVKTLTTILRIFHNIQSFTLELDFSNTKCEEDSIKGYQKIVSRLSDFVFPTRVLQIRYKHRLLEPTIHRRAYLQRRPQRDIIDKVLAIPLDIRLSEKLSSDEDICGNKGWRHTCTSKTKNDAKEYMEHVRQWYSINARRQDRITVPTLYWPAIPRA